MKLIHPLGRAELSKTSASFTPMPRACRCDGGGSDLDRQYAGARTPNDKPKNCGCACGLGLKSVSKSRASKKNEVSP